MTGIEKMLAGMLGITPQQMQETINGAVNLLTSLNTRLEELERMTRNIHEVLCPSDEMPVLEGTENAESN